MVGTLHPTGKHLDLSRGPLVAEAKVIRAEWTKEAAVWVAAFDDVLGLATEAATMAALSDKLGDLDPELSALNGYAVAGEIQPTGVNSSRRSRPDPLQGLRWQI